MAFIAHTAPDDKIPSKNQLIHIGVPNNSNVGEKIVNDKINPPQVEKHIGQLNIPEMKCANPLKGRNLSSPHFLNESLNPWNIDP
jgi:hypothetical protein